MASMRTPSQIDDLNGFSIERGPGWLFVRVPECGGRDTVGIVSGLLKTSMTNRVVLELDRVGNVDGDLAEAISVLGREIQRAGGVIRICGLSDSNLAAIRRDPEASRIPHYACRAEAVLAARAPVLVGTVSAPPLDAPTRSSSRPSEANLGGTSARTPGVREE